MRRTVVIRPFLRHLDSIWKAGERIHDHDIALGYVLDHHAHVLPSYAGLSKRQQALFRGLERRAMAQDSIRFTQCKMEYNMGWLVQALRCS